MAAGKPCKAVKIGVTTQKTLLQRLRAVQNGNHEIVHVLGVIACDGMERPMVAAETKEKELHQAFLAHRRFEPGWVGSEWFTMTAQIQDYIQHNTVTPESLGLSSTLAKPIAIHHERQTA